MVRTSFKCKNSANLFCYICGKYCVIAQQKTLTDTTKLYYSLYFGFEVKIEDWTPNTCCKTCESALNSWWNGTRNRLPFAVPVIWKKQRNHRNDCYFCLANVTGFSAKNKNKIVYPNCQSVSKPILHGDTYPVPVTPNQVVKDKHTTANLEALLLSAEEYKDPEYVPIEDCDEPHMIDQ